jgi:GDP/UDP-N,N'-diacetylbacillosamine 2-epimerase (hydrolysing)
MKKLTKNICIVTGSRADYDLLKNLIIEIKKIKQFKLSIIVTGQHLSKNYGNTGKQVYKDFGKFCKSIDINIKKTTSTAILNSLSIGIKGAAKYFNSKKPDLIILLGDRYEILPIAIASIYNNIKIAHIHGGEVTSGSIDDIIRHSITKFSHFHFVSTNIYKKRVIQLGENPSFVFNVGALGAENVKKIKLLDKKKLKKKLDINFDKYIFLITINSFIEQNISIQLFLKNIFLTLKKFNNTTFIFTMPNSDLKSDFIKNRILNFCKSNKNAFFFKSMGAQNYLSCMKICDVVLGNSSSGILEAPSLKKSTVNIGDRQNGRVQANSVINSGYSEKKIYDSIKKALSPNFKKQLYKTKNPYFKENTASNIVKIINAKILNKDIKMKKFYDN